MENVLYTQHLALNCLISTPFVTHSELWWYWCTV